MGDIALLWDPAVGDADFFLENDDLATDEGMRTAVLLSIVLDRRADDGDALPDVDGDKRGWWGDEFAENEGDQIGGKRWLLSRSTLSPALLPIVEQYDRESLQWMLDDLVGASIDLEYQIVGNQLRTAITVNKSDGTFVAVQFEHVWEGELGQ